MRKRNYTVTIRMNKAEYDLLQNKGIWTDSAGSCTPCDSRFKNCIRRGSGRIEKAEPDACRDTQSASWCSYKSQPDCKKNEYGWFYAKGRYFVLSQQKYSQIQEGE